MGKNLRKAMEDAKKVGQEQYVTQGKFGKRRLSGEKVVCIKPDGNPSITVVIEEKFGGPVQRKEFSDPTVEEVASWLSQHCEYTE